MSAHIRQLDSIISKLVRVQAADQFGYVRCVSCDAILPWKFAQCAHFISRQHMSLRFEMDNLGPACFRCNNVEPEKHLEVWASKMSFERLTRLRALSRTMTKFTRREIEDMIKINSDKLNQLLKQKKL